MKKGLTEVVELFIGAVVVVFLVWGLIMIMSSGSSTGNSTGTDSSLQSTTLSGQDIPVPTDYITDMAGVLNASTTQANNEKLAAFSSSGNGEIAVLVVKSLNGLTIEEYGIRVGEAWKVGKYGADNGNILIISTGDRKVRIETGGGSKITDSEATNILSSSIVPMLKINNWDGAVSSGISALIQASGK